MVMCTRHLRQARQDLFEEGLDVDKLEAIAKVSGSVCRIECLLLISA